MWEPEDLHEVRRMIYTASVLIGFEHSGPKKVLEKQVYIIIHALKAVQKNK